MRDNLIGLIDMFIFQRASTLAPPPPSGTTERLGVSDPLGAAEEVQLLMAVQKQLEDQPDLGLRYCVFDAIFGAISEVRGIFYFRTDTFCFLFDAFPSRQSPLPYPFLFLFPLPYTPPPPLHLYLSTPLTPPPLSPGTLPSISGIFVCL